MYRVQSTGRSVHRPARGFTLIEMLIVCSLMALISIGIYAIFNNGLRIYKRVSQAVPEEDLAIFFDKFAYDVRNTFTYSTLSFSGDQYSLEFAALLNSPALHSLSPGKVSYFFDREQGVLFRRQRDISQLYTRGEGQVVALLHNVKDARFTYYYYDKEEKEYSWNNIWTEEKKLPRAVRIEMQWDNGSQINEFRRTVGIPVSEQLYEIPVTAD